MASTSLAPFGVTRGASPTFTESRNSAAALSVPVSFPVSAARILVFAGMPRSVSSTSAASCVLTRKFTNAAASAGCLDREEIDQNIDGL
jgi:hypothetical protein